MNKKNQSLIICKNLNIIHKNGNQYLWKNLNFTLKKNEIIGILGANGSGKTSLFREIMETNNSQNKKNMQINNKIAYLSSEMNSIFSLNVFDVILSGRIEARGIFAKPNRQDIECSEFYLKILKLKPLMKQAFHQLSSGEKQRTLIARALVSEAKILLLDEIDQHLDFYHQEFFIKLIQWLQIKKNLGILIISHNFNWVKKLASSFLIPSFPIQKPIPLKKINAKLLKHIYHIAFKKFNSIASLESSNPNSEKLKSKQKNLLLPHFYA